MSGCDCCDPTADSEDPVVVRLERENERLRAIIDDVKKHVDSSSCWSAGPAFFGILMSKLDGGVR